MRFRGPLADSYPAAIALVVFALVPYLALSSAFTPLTPILSRSLGLSDQALSLTGGMANAAYTFGTVLAVQFAVHLKGRRMLVLYATLSLIGSLLAASAPTAGCFVVGHVLQGFCTSLMLIAAVPPLVVGWPTSKIPSTAVVMNMCVFGAVALGPVVGGLQAGAGDWRPLFWIVAGFGALALLFVVLTFEDQAPADRSAPWDWVAVILAGAGCAAAFFGASELQTHSAANPVAVAPLAIGIVLLAALVGWEYRARNPLIPVRRAATTFPVAGIIVAMSAGAASVAVVELVQTGLQSAPPAHLGLLFMPEVVAAAASAVALGVLLRTRFVPVLAFAGVVMLSAGAVVLTGVVHGPDALVLIGSGLLGLGVGSSVSPAMFVVGFSLRSGQLQRVFALVELLRGVAAFLVAPIVLHVAMTASRTPAAGVSTGIWIGCAIAATGGLLAAAVFFGGGARLQRPQLDRWNAGEQPAWYTPPLGARLRSRRRTAGGARTTGA